MKYKRLGEILIEDKIITLNQLDEALHIQHRSEELLGKILVKLDYIPQDILNKYLNIQEKL